MPSKFLLILNLMRLGSPSVYAVYFFPASFGLLLSSNLTESIGYLVLFFIGSITTRGAGCIINDIFDKDFDKHVQRTKNRPLASGDLTLKEALIALTLLSLFNFLILLTLSRTAIIIGLITAVMTGLYPLMKRITYLPQLFLGFTINLGVLIGYATMHDTISLSSMLLYLSCCFWTLGYDTIYAFMDTKDDRKVGIKSLALLLENKNYKFWLTLFYTIFIAMFYLSTAITGYLALGLVCLALLVLFWQVITLNINDSVNCRQRFNANNFVGLVLCLAMCLQY